MKRILINGFRLNEAYSLKLVEDVPDEVMTQQPHGFSNHPKFTIGHLVTATALTAEILGESYRVPEGWDDLFRRKGPGDPNRPTQIAAQYPHKDELVSVFTEKCDVLVNLIEVFDEQNFGENYEWRFARFMPTVGDVLFFFCHIHHSWHIGQLAEWRRLMGFDSALAKL